jgi:uncharacterized protein YejL (UPF0352 family)
MAKYPTTQEIRNMLTDEQVAELLADLPSYHRSPVDLVNLALKNVTPEILTAYAALVKAVRAEYPTATATTTAISRPKTDAELLELALQSEVSAEYSRRLDAEKAATE